MKKHFLATPGPTQVPEKSLLRQAEPIIHHRSPAYTKLLLEVIGGLKYVFQTENDVLLFTSSGTGAMESAVANLFSEGDKVLIASTGNFGERWVKISQAFGLNVRVLDYGWGGEVNPDEVKKALDEDVDLKGVLMTHSETSTGVVNDLKAVSEITRGREEVTLVVDAVSSLGACELRTDEWGVDVVVSGSQKALMSPPGLSCVAISEKAWRFVDKSTLPKFYFDYKAYKKKLSGESPQNPYTPAVSTVVALSESLRMIKREGIENVWKRHKVIAKAAREGVKAMNLELFSPDRDESVIVTAVNTPSNVGASDVIKIMREEYGIWVAGGQGELKGKIFRIGHCGYYSPSDIVMVLSALERTLLKLGHKFEPGSGINEAQKVFTNSGI
jgi:aspartate aminotransferase-like enzyme